MLILAYLDPGTGSIVVQAVVAGLAGVGVMLRLGWRRLASRGDRRDPKANLLPPDAEEQNQL